MSGYKGSGKIEKIEWTAPDMFNNPHAVAVRVAIPVADFAGLDITRPITITQGEQ